MATPAIDVEGLTVRGAGGHFWRRPRAILAGVSFSLPVAARAAFLGANGSGKTTTFKAILGLVRPHAGTVQILGRPAAHPESRARLGFLPERPYFPGHLSAEEVVLHHALLAGLPWRAARRATTARLAEVGLTAAARRRLTHFSKGMLQRVGLAQALVGQPAVVVMDEPMSGLDAEGRGDMREAIGALAGQGVTLLMSTHDLADAEALCAQAVVLAAGRVVYTGSLDGLTQRAPGPVEVGATALPVGCTAPLPAGVRPAAGCGAYPRFVAADWEAANRLIDHLRGHGAEVREVARRRGALATLIRAARAP